MYFVIALVLIIGSFLLYATKRRLFFLSIFAVYPIVAQMTSIDVEVFGAQVNIPMVYGSILCAISLLEFMQQLVRGTILRGKGLLLLSTLLLLSCFGSILASSNKYESFLASTKIATWVLLILVSQGIFNSLNDLAWIGRLGLVTSAVVGTSYVASRFGLYGKALGGYQYYDFKIDVAVGYFHSVVSLAYPLVVCVPIILIGVLLFRRTYVILAVVLSVFVVLLTYVRAPLVALCSGFLAFAYYTSKYKVERFSKTLVLGCVAFVIVFILFQHLQPATATRRWVELKDQVQTRQYEKFGSGRVGLAMNAFKFQFTNQTLLGHLFGIGVGNTGSISPSKKVVHNAFLEVWLGCGIIGLILYLSFVMTLWRAVRSVMKRSIDKRLLIAGALAAMNFWIFLLGNMDVILTAVFPMSLLAIHLGATLGVARAFNSRAVGNSL